MNLSINIVEKHNICPQSAGVVGDIRSKDFTLNQARVINTHRGLYTENINSCTALFLKSGKEHAGANIAPELQSLGNIKNSILDIVDKVRKSGEDIHGFLVGGLALDKNDPESIKSFDLYNSIADVLDELGVKFSMFCGKAKGSALEDVYTVGQNVNIHNPALVKLLSNTQPTEENLMKALEKTYQIVEKNATHKLQLFV